MSANVNMNRKRVNSSMWFEKYPTVSVVSVISSEYTAAIDLLKCFFIEKLSQKPLTTFFKLLNLKCTTFYYYASKFIDKLAFLTCLKVYFIIMDLLRRLFFFPLNFQCSLVIWICNVVDRKPAEICIFILLIAYTIIRIKYSDKCVKWTILYAEMVGHFV